MKTFTGLLFLFFLSLANTNAQVNIQWQRSLGGSDPDQASSSASMPTPDNGSIHIGSSASNDGDVTGHHGTLGTDDVWVVKLDSTGVIEWQQSYGGSGSDRGGDIKITSDGGYIFAGESMSSDGDLTSNNGLSDFWIVKIDIFGAIQWQKSYGGPSYDFAECIQQTPDGGYLVLGNSDSAGADVSFHYGKRDLWLIKLDSLGNLLWERSLGGSENEQCESNGLELTADNGFIITSNTSSVDGDVSMNNGIAGTSDYWLVKTDSLGFIQWNKSYGGTGAEVTPALLKTSDGGYMLAGSTNSPVSGDVSMRIPGPGDIWVIKTDSAGNKQFDKTLGGSIVEFANALLEDNDGGYILAGMTLSNDINVSGNHGSFDIWIVKTDSLVNPVWQRCLGGTAFEFPNDIHFANDSSSINGLLITGTSSSNDGDVSGHHGTSGVAGPRDFWIVKVMPAATGVTVDDLAITATSIYPNPVSATTNISFFQQKPGFVSVSILDLSGRCVANLHNGFLNEGLQQFEWNTRNINGHAVENGIYFLSLQGTNFRLAEKIIVSAW